MSDGGNKTVLIVRYPVPSLNRLFAMNPWQRKKEKVATQNAFMSALSAIENGSATRIIFAESILSIASATRKSSRMTGQKILRLKSPKRNPKTNGQKST